MDIGFSASSRRLSAHALNHPVLGIAPPYSSSRSTTQTGFMGERAQRVIPNQYRPDWGISDRDSRYRNIMLKPRMGAIFSQRLLEASRYTSLRLGIVALTCSRYELLTSTPFES